MSTEQQQRVMEQLAEQLYAGGATARHPGTRSPQGGGQRPRDVGPGVRAGSPALTGKMGLKSQWPNGLGR
jgi:hypothetical protein